MHVRMYGSGCNRFKETAKTVKFCTFDFENEGQRDLQSGSRSMAFIRGRHASELTLMFSRYREVAKTASFRVF